MSRESWVKLGLDVLVYSVVLYVMLAVFRPETTRPVELTVIGAEDIRMTDEGFFRAVRDTTRYRLEAAR